MSVVRVRWRPLAISAAVAILCLAAYFELVEDYSSSAAVAFFDSRVASAIVALRTPTLNWVMRAVTVTGDTIIVTVFTAALAVWLWSRHRRLEAGVLVACVAGGAALSSAFKGLLGRVRPPQDGALIGLPTSASFPSGHAMAGVTLAAAVAWIALRDLKSRVARVATVAALLLWAAAVGLSRVYLGVHWPSDVLASWLLGGAWVALVIGVAEASRPDSTSLAEGAE